MKLRFEESKETIAKIAGAYQYDEDQKELVELARWKSPRSAGHVKKNSRSYIAAITKFAFATKEDRCKIEALTLLDGVGWPTASAILHFYDTNDYPILDYRALWSVGEDEQSQYKYAFWEKYTELCRRTAKRNNVDMRTLDRALWQYSKENQNK